MNAKENSKASFEAKGSYENIKMGCMQRIADSLEKMERPFLQQITEIENLRASRDRYMERLDKLQSKYNGLQGYKKKLENQLAQLRKEAIDGCW